MIVSLGYKLHRQKNDFFFPWKVINVLDNTQERKQESWNQCSHCLNIVLSVFSIACGYIPHPVLEIIVSPSIYVCLHVLVCWADLLFAVTGFSDAPLTWQEDCRSLCVSVLSKYSTSSNIEPKPKYCLCSLAAMKCLVYLDRGLFKLLMHCTQHKQNSIVAYEKLKSLRLSVCPYWWN